jgi:hypothetical protein
MAGMGFALDSAQEELAEDLGNAQSYFASKGTDGISQALHETNPADREALAANLDKIEQQRARERSEDIRTSSDFERAATHELAQQHDARDAHAAEQTKVAYDQYRRQQAAAERERLIRQAERARLENEALRDTAFPQIRERQQEELNRQAAEIAEANLLPSELARQGRFTEAIDRLSTQALEASVQASEVQFQRAVATDIERRQQIDGDTCNAINHFSASKYREAQLLNLDPAAYVRTAALNVIAVGHRDGVAPADALVHAGRSVGYRTPAEVNAWQQNLARQRHQLNQERQEARETQRQRLFDECRTTYWNTDRRQRGNLIYDRAFMDKAKRSGFAQHLRGHMTTLY